MLYGFILHKGENMGITIRSTTKSIDMGSVNELVALANSGVPIAKFSSKDVNAELPSAVRNQIAKDVRSIIKKHYKECHKAVLENRKLEKRGSDKRIFAPKLPVVKRRCCYWNNQNFCISKDVFKTDDTIYLSFPVMIDGKCTRIRVRTSMEKRQYELLKNKHLGRIRTNARRRHDSIL